MQKSKKLIVAASFSLLLGAGCASGETTPLAETDAGSDQNANIVETDAGSGGEDMSVPAPPSLQPTVTPTGGGANLETGQHKMRLIVAPPTPAGSVETSQHRIQLGAGAAQHGQQND